MKLLVLYSGGKDSTYAIFKALQSGHDIECLLTMLPERKDSYMYHVPNIEITEFGARAMDYPLIYYNTTGEKEKELIELEEAIKDLKEELGIEGVLTGAVASKYQADRIGAIAEKLGLKCVNPLWDRNNIGLLEEMVSEKFEIMIVGVYAGGLDESWLGKVIGEKEISELNALNEKYSISPLGEGGEIETLVVDCPLYKKKIEIVESEKEFDGSRGELKIKKVELRDK